jgi:Protein of unknown function (DUF3800)
VFFGAVVERSYRDYEERAWEEVLHRFDEMLERQARTSGVHQRGIVIHDRDGVERRAQSWADKWRLISGRIGVLTHLVEVPLFADSRASRMLQAADFVTWALWRYYGLNERDDEWVRRMWRRFDQADGVMHGLVHVSRSFASLHNACECPPCRSRRPAIRRRAPARAGVA